MAMNINNPVSLTSVLSNSDVGFSNDVEAVIFAMNDIEAIIKQITDPQNPTDAQLKALSAAILHLFYVCGPLSQDPIDRNKAIVPYVEQYFQYGTPNLYQASLDYSKNPNSDTLKELRNAFANLVNAPGDYYSEFLDLLVKFPNNPYPPQLY